MVEEQHNPPDKASLRVLHVVSGDLWAGAEVQVWQLLRAAQRVEGVDIHAVVLNPDLLVERLSADGVAVTVLDESKYSFPKLAGELRRFARRWRPDVIHTHRRKEHLLGALAAKACGAALAATMHGREEFTHSQLNLRQRILHGTEQLVLTRIHDALIAVSDDLAGDLPGPATHKVIIPNSVDSQAIRATAARDSPAIPRNMIQIGFLGRLVPVKQVDHMVKMMALLEAERPGCHFLHLIGEGPLRKDLETLAETLGIHRRVEFHGFIENPLPLLAKMDCYLFASAHEGLPMSALEALSLGVPLVSPPIASLERLIRESMAGRIAASSEPRDLADAVLMMARLDRRSGDVKPSLLPERYEVENGLRATLDLWNKLAKGIES